MNSVDELEWDGSSAELVDLARAVDAPALADHAVRLAEVRASS